MAKLGRSINNNDGSQLAALRAVNQIIDVNLPKSDLTNVKDKLLATEILIKLSEKLNISQENLGQYLLELNSKTIDATLSRIVDVIQKSETITFTNDQLNSIRGLLNEYVSQINYNQSQTIDHDVIIQNKNEIILQLTELFNQQTDKLQNILATNQQQQQTITIDEDFINSKINNNNQEETDNSLNNIDDALNNSTTQILNSSEDNANNIKTELEDSIKQYISSIINPKVLNVIPNQVSNELIQLNETLNTNITNVNSNTILQTDNINKELINITSYIQSIQQQNKEIISNIENTQPVDINQISKALNNIEMTPKIEVQSDDSELQSIIIGVKTSIIDFISSSIKNIGASIKKGFSNVGSLVLSPFKAVSSSIKNIGASIKKGFSNVGSLVLSPFKAVSSSIKNIGASIKKGFSNVGSLVGSTLKSISVNSIKAIGNTFSKLNPFKKKKKKKDPMAQKLSKLITKVNDFIDNFFNIMLGYVDAFLDSILKSAKKIVSSLMMHIFTWLLVNVALLGLLFTLIINFIAEPIKKLLQPILDFLAPVRDFLINVLSKVVDNIIIPFGTFFLEVLKSIFELVLIPLLKGIGSVAEALGKALGRLIIGIADFMVDVLLPFLRDCFLPVIGAILNVIKLLFDGMASYAFQIGQGLGKFVTVVLNVLTLLMEGFGTHAKAIGEAIAKVVLAVVNVVALIVQFVENCVGIFVEITGIIRDFFTGFRTHAKAIGEKMSLIALELADMMYEFVKAIKPIILDLYNTIRLKVVAPITALKLKFDGWLVKLAEKFIIPVPIVDFHGSIYPWNWEVKIEDCKPFSFITENLTPEQKSKALENADKDISQLIEEEVSRTQALIDEEKRQKAAAKLAAELQQEKIEKMVASIDSVDKIFAVVDANYKMLANIAKSMNIIPETIQNIDNKTQAEDIINKAKVEVESITIENIPSTKNNTNSNIVPTPKISIENNNAIKNIKASSTSEIISLQDQFKSLTESSNSLFNIIKPIVPIIHNIQNVSNKSYTYMEEKFNELLNKNPDFIPIPLNNQNNNLATIENI